MRNPAVLITRPKDDAAAFAKKLKAIGIDSIIAPVISVHQAPLAIEQINEALHEPAQAILVTSRNAVAAIARSDCNRQLPILAVGDATASKLIMHGFTHVTAAAGTATDLLAEAVSIYSPKRGKLLYICGDVLSLDMVHELHAKGFKAEQITAYHTHPISEFTPEVIKAHEDKEFDAVSFFSVQTATIYQALAKTHGLLKDIGLLEAFCISTPTAEIAKQLKWKKIHVSLQPTQASLLSTIKEAFYNQRI